jgi:two-component system chemotaxis response regulator CheB
MTEATAGGPKKIKVLVVDDSPSVLDLLTYILSSDPGIEVIGTALTGKRALKFLETKTPDLVTMDMDMPEMDGLEATRFIMENNPIPIIIVSASWSPSEVTSTLKALEAGAVAIMEKPRGIGHPKYPEMAAELIKSVRTLSSVKLVRRWPKIKEAIKDTSVAQPDIKIGGTRIKLVAIGASTGGPPAIQAILAELPDNLGVPVLIVQHIANGFLKGLQEWLASSTGKKVLVASDKERLLPGHFYLAPNGYQTGIDNSGIVRLTDPDPLAIHCPSVSFLFKSVAEAYGREAVGVLLTGMGRDGAVELKLMRDRGATTFAQDETSSVIWGMPGEAIKLEAAKYILPPAAIANTIAQIVNPGS